MSTEHPRVFISYSWSSDEYQRRVVDLATRLRKNGVDAVMDVWKLRPGHEKYRFMERHVTDEGIEKVLILCDRRYAEKADGHAGGVGDETEIITPKIYGNTEQEKFIPVVMERDRDGEAFLPTYLGSRMYVDLSGDDFEERYEELLRCIYDQPKYVMPELGQRPSWLDPKVTTPEQTGTPGLAERERATESLPALSTPKLLSVPKEPDTPESSAKVPVRSFAEYSWAELKYIANEIAAASDYDGAMRVARHYCLVDDKYRLSGDDTRLVILNDRNMSHALVRIAGFRHDDTVESDGWIKSGITFEFANVPLVRRMNPAWDNAGGWKKSEMRSILNGSFFDLLPYELRSRILKVRKHTNNRGGDARDDVSAVTVTEDKIWLFSVTELYGDFSRQYELSIEDFVDTDRLAVYNAEGRQYKLYMDQGVSVKKYDFCKKGGACSWWWLRSPNAYHPSTFLYTKANGDWEHDLADNAGGVSSGFCF